MFHSKCIVLDPDSVDKVVLICIHIIKDRKLLVKKALTEQQINMQKQKQLANSLSDRERDMDRRMGMGGGFGNGYGSKSK